VDFVPHALKYGLPEPRRQRSGVRKKARINHEEHKGKIKKKQESLFIQNHLWD
jgi:hypothetical protein